MIAEIDNAVHSNRLTRMIDEVSDILLEMNSNDMNQLNGQAWLDEQMSGESNETTEKSSSTEQEVKETVTPRNRLELETQREDILGVTDESEANEEASELVDVADAGEVEEEKIPKVIVTKLKPIKKNNAKNIELVSIKPKKAVDSVYDERGTSDLSDVAVQKNGFEKYDFEKEDSLSSDVSPELTKNQQNIKNVFEQVMGTERANQESTAVEFINYCIVQTRNAFGLKTTLQDFELLYDEADVMVSRAQEGLSEVELAKCYLQYLLEEVEFLRYLEPKEELLIPKIEAGVTTRDFNIKEIPIVESTLKVKATFARGRDYSLMARVLKISMDMKEAPDVLRALKDSSGGVVFTIDGRTKLPRTIENNLKHAKLAFAKLSGKEIQEQIVTVDSLKFDSERILEKESQNISEYTTSEKSETKVSSEDMDKAVPSFWEQWQQQSEKESIEPEIPAVLTENSAPAMEQVVIEKVEAPVETPVLNESLSLEKEAEAEAEKAGEVQLNEEECRSLLKFLATAIDTDYKPYLRMSREDQEADLILDLQSYLSDMGEQVKYKQEYKYSKRLKEIYRPLYEIAKANGYSLETLRAVEDFTEFDLENDDFQDKETIYLYQILLAIKDYWKELQLLLEKEEQEREREEAERIAREEQEREKAERIAREEQEREEAERTAQEEQEELERDVADSEVGAEGAVEADTVEELEPEAEQGTKPDADGNVEDDWLNDFGNEEPESEFDIESELGISEKKPKKDKKKKSKEKSESLNLDLSDGEIINDDSRVSKKVITGFVVGVVAIVGIGGFGVYEFNHYLNDSGSATTHNSSATQNKVNVLKGALDEKSQVTFIDKNNSNKLSPNPYDKLLLAHADKVSDDQLKKLGLTQKTSLTITDSGEQVSITVSGVVSSKEAKVTGIPQLKDVDYLKWIDSNNVPYFMPFKV